MFKRVSEWLIKVSRGWVVLVLLAVFVVFNATVAVRQLEVLKEYRGDAGSVDMSLFYGAEDVFRMAEEYGEIGRQKYIHQAFTFDGVYPLIYMFALVSTLSWLAGKIYPVGSNWRILNMVPILSMLFDYLENSLAIVVMKVFPERVESAAALLPYASFGKWLLIAVSLILIFYFFVVLWIKSRKKS